MIDPAKLAVELGYTLIVVLICFMIYFKTREIYDLTKYEGINYFRMTFLFFGLAYIFRFMDILAMLIRQTFESSSLLDTFRIFPFPLVINGYFSTLAILSLTYSLIWKKLHIENTLLLFNVIAILISSIALISRSPFLLILAQAALLIFTIIMACYIYIKSKDFSQLFILYILFVLFWIVNLLPLGPQIFLPFEVQIVSEAISIALIGIIYYKVAKWTK
ncbi:MAG TPA: hypothetical protein VIO58_00420 [Candidatus Methanoperedens sp.]